MKWRLILAGGVLTVLAVLVQEYSLRRYGLSLDIPERIWVQLVAGWTFLIVGVTATRLRPDSGLGGWMSAFGLVWIGGLVFTAPLTQWHAIAWAVALYGLLLIMLYTFPEGRLGSRDRWIAAGWLGFLTVAAAVVLSSVDFYGEIVDRVCCPSHLLYLGTDPELGQQILALGLILVTAMFLAVVFSQVRKWRRTTRFARRSLTRLAIVLAPVVAFLLVVPIVNALTHGLPGFVPGASDLSFNPLPSRANLYLQNGMLVLFPLVIISGLLTLRFSQARIGQMVAELAAPMPTGELEGRLREALNDPTLHLGFPVADSEGLVGVDGRTLTDLDPGLVATRLDEVTVIHDAALDPGLIASAGTAASLAIRNARLQAELRSQLIEVKESRRRLVNATDEARRRVERDLHDGAQQRLVALSATLRKAKDRGTMLDPALEDLLSEAAAETDVAIGELRELARGVHPAILTQAGLRPAVAGLADRAPLPVTVDIVAGRYPEAVEATAYFLVAEGLANVFKHSGASEATVTIREDRGALTVEVRDDGTGSIDPTGSGIRGLSDRVGALGGSLETGKAGGGTFLLARIPLEGSGQ